MKRGRPRVKRKKDPERKCPKCGAAKELLQTFCDACTASALRLAVIPADKQAVFAEIQALRAELEFAKRRGAGLLGKAKLENIRLENKLKQAQQENEALKAKIQRLSYASKLEAKVILLENQLKQAVANRDTLRRELFEATHELAKYKHPPTGNH